MVHLPGNHALPRTVILCLGTAYPSLTSKVPRHFAATEDNSTYVSLYQVHDAGIAVIGFTTVAHGVVAARRLASVS